VNKEMTNMISDNKKCSGNKAPRQYAKRIMMGTILEGWPERTLLRRGQLD
jgi:hypothetical protein